MKTLASFILAFLAIPTTSAIIPISRDRELVQVTCYEQELASLETAMFHLEQQIAFNVQHDYYTDYPNRRAQELIARLGLREFNTSVNPFTHIGRYMDKNADVNKKYPDRIKQKKLRKELCKIIQEHELKSYRTKHKEIMQQLRQAIVHLELAILQQKNGYEFTNQDLKQLKILKRLVDPSYRQELSRKIAEYDSQINSLRSKINSLRSMRETALALHHSGCMFCVTCHKKSHTCHICHTCVDHCSCFYQIAQSTLALIADISAQESIANLTKHLHTIEASRNRLQQKLSKLNKSEQVIWNNYLKNKLHNYQMASTNCIHQALESSCSVNPALMNYHINLLQRELGCAPVQHLDSDNDNTAVLVGLGCAALAGAGCIAICYGAANS